ncbi:cellulase family glycosylhydrolase [Hymenobacter chitinivorans]|uniref:mannan endo-1,4-beta-mannosidase n=1 Tax=Hymenobacter chitinivorans DSM 11115 TaxID=1121954 RepID=A0A2M9B4P7_9BACT|nr:cellulase family glycosylhydrolase [Hymenobacter chitinivorans]PJJ52930.1 cellulase (glycosyl hydrolase family 5) [Hymenobacter chitinivorans DSM 11115]
MPSALPWLLGLAALVFSLCPAARAQTPPPTGDVYVDGQGVLRWQQTKREVALFGVNYTAPFAHAYRAQQAVGGSAEKAIDQDVYHLARLGLDAFRIHVWDVEITDTLGNLQQNEHLRLLDYLVAQLKQRGIKVILTPIAYWNNGYPEKDSGTGFSSMYSKVQAYTNPRAIRAQENYLTQFLNHRNQYTRLLNREDPDILAFEVCNEPRYQQPAAQVTAFANRMVAAMRATGYGKPIFYNIAENPEVEDAILAANVDGLTFQWYPAGLVSGHTLRGNLLPHVDQYPIPFRQDPRFRRRAKLVYEFESGDIIQPVMYPMMARSFREAGFQWATQFAYDPLAIAYANTEYQTHYLNLAYTPAKALSLLIAGKVFRRVGRGQSFGRYPADSVFDAFRVSYRRGLSEMSTEEEFYYTASTQTIVKKVAKLRHVAGVGSSPLVQYGGSGAYFLDRVAPGMWRLEVLPDAVPIRDPFETASLQKPVTQILWNDQPLRLALPELGPRFTLRGLNEGNTAQAQATDGRLTVRPGVYLLAAAGKQTSAWTADSPLGSLRLGEFAAPAPTKLGPQVRHTPPAQATAGQPLIIRATLTGIEAADSVFLVAQHYYGRTRVLPVRQPAYATVEATVPAELTTAGLLRYWLVLKKAGQPLTFPGGFRGQPQEWDFFSPEHWEVPLVTAQTPLFLFRAAADQGQVEARSLSRTAWTEYVTTEAAGALALRFVQGEAKEAAAPAAETGPAACLRAYYGDKLPARRQDLSGFTEVVVKARASRPVGAQVVLATQDAAAFAAPVPLTTELREIRIPLSSFNASALLLSPRPYPGFLPLRFQSSNPGPLRLADTEVVQLLVDAAAATQVDIESIFLR